MLLVDPELPAELVDLRLQRGDAGLEFGKFGLGLLACGSGLLGIVGDDFLELQAVDDGVVLEAVGFERGDLLLEFGQRAARLAPELRIVRLRQQSSTSGMSFSGTRLRLSSSEKPSCSMS